MYSNKLCITLWPLIYNWIKDRVKTRQVSISRCIEDVIEEQMDNVIITEKELEQLLAETKAHLFSKRFYVV